MLAETPAGARHLQPGALPPRSARGVRRAARPARRTLRLGLTPADRARRGRAGLRAARALHGPPENLIGRFPRFAELLAAARAAQTTRPRCARRPPRFSAAGHARPPGRWPSWPGSTWTGSADDRGPARRLIAKGRGYTRGRQARSWPSASRRCWPRSSPPIARAADEGRIELSTSPYYHPILPLLCDSDAHHEAHPGATLPRRFRHPEDAADQIQRAIDAPRRRSSARPPAGMWPSEGSVSEEAVTEIARAGLRWTASDEGVLERSSGRPLHRDSRGHRSSRSSSSIGPGSAAPPPERSRCCSATARSPTSSASRYSGAGSGARRPRPARAPAAHRRALDAARGWPGDPVVPIILDGENAWEHYPRGRPDVPAPLLRGPRRTDPRSQRGDHERGAWPPARRASCRACSRGAGSTRTSRCGSATPTTAAPGTCWATRATRWRGGSEGTVAADALERALRGLPGRLRQRLVLVVRRRPLLGERPRVRSPVPPPPARGVRGRRPAACPTASRRDAHHHPPPRGTAEPARGRGRLPSSTARSRPRTSGWRPGVHRVPLTGAMHRGAPGRPRRPLRRAAGAT